MGELQQFLHHTGGSDEDDLPGAIRSLAQLSVNRDDRPEPGRIQKRRGREIEHQMPGSGGEDHMQERIADIAGSRAIEVGQQMRQGPAGEALELQGDPPISQK